MGRGLKPDGLATHGDTVVIASADHRPYDSDTDAEARFRVLVGRVGERITTSPSSELAARPDPNQPVPERLRPWARRVRRPWWMCGRTRKVVGMSDTSEPLPATPWEFLRDDDQREDPPAPAEEAALHVERLLEITDEPAAPADDAVVHYLEDEQPEIPDGSAPVQDRDVTPEVEDLLIRQHYMDRDETN